MKPDLFWIPGPWRGKLAVAMRPRGGDWLQDEAKGWRQAGLDVIVSLLEPDEAAQLELDREHEVAQSNSLQFISFPIPDRGVPASMQDALALLGDVSRALEEGKTVAIHCRQGIGRSGMIAAATVVNAGIEVKRALEIVSAARGQTVPETPAQLQWIHHLPAEHLVG